MSSFLPNFTTFVIRAFQNLLEGVFTLIADLSVISVFYKGYTMIYLLRIQKSSFKTFDLFMDRISICYWLLKCIDIKLTRHIEINT